MTEEIEMALDMAKESMEKAMEHLNTGLTKIRAGKASPSMLDNVKVDYYGAKSLLSQVANINTLDARTITVQPWEKELIAEIEKAIINANLGLNPQNNGESIMINVPVLTEERRINLTKQAKAEGEQAKISIRNIRKEANDIIKEEEKNNLAEDIAKAAEAKIQALTNEFVSKIDKLVSIKEIDIMTV